MPKLTVLIADDHNLVRAGFRSLLKQVEGVEVVAEAQNGRDAWDLIVSLQPAVALVDISMPLLNGLELTARVAAGQPATRVVVLSMHSSADYVQRAMSAGAAGYLLKNTSPSELEQALRAVDRGETHFKLRAGHPAHSSLHADAGALTKFKRLTPRQRQFLQLIGEGNTTKAIARLMGISIKTAEAHRANLMERLDLHDVSAVVRFGVAVGVVNPEC